MDPNQNENPQPEPPVTSTNPPAAARETGTPASEPQSQPQPVTVSTDDIPAPAPATPPAAAPSTDSAPTAQQPVVSPAPKSKKGLLIGLPILIAVIGLAATGYFVTKPGNSSPQKAVATTVKKDIPVLQVAPFLPLPHTYYPNVQADSYQADIQNQLFESLTKFENDTKLEPNLATGWTNPDSSTWIFKLSPNVKFHTGKIMAASDVKASIEKAETTDYGKPFTSTIKEVDVVDPLTVKIITNGPDPLLANELTNIYIYDTTSGKANDPINGTGPYTLKSDTPDAVTLVAFDGYHGGHVYAREVRYLGYSDSSQVSDSDLKSRKIQFLAIRSDPRLVARLNGTGYTTASEPSYDVSELIMNTTGNTNPALANVKVRKIIAQSLDVSKIIGFANSGPGTLRSTQSIAKGIPGYNPAIKAPVELTAAESKAALAEAGYPNGFNLKLTFFAEYPNNGIVSEIQRQLALVGISVKPDPQTDQQKLVDIALGGKTDMFYVINSSTIVDGSDVLSMFIDSPNYSSKQLDTLSDQASHEINPEKRVAILQNMQQLVENDQADIPLFQRQSYIFATDPSIVLKRDTLGSAIGTYFWQTYAK